MWVTEEYAAKDFESLWKTQQKDPKIIPKKAIKTQILVWIKFKLPKIRKKPAVPNFRSKPANNILAVVGASTWALGNQRCKK